MHGRIIAGTLTTIVTLLFIGCSAKELSPGAARVIVSKTAAPAGCHFRGSVIGEQGGSFTGVWTSNRALAEGAMNDMKNKAAALGANYVVLENSNAGNTFSGSKYGMSGGQTDITHMGNAYQCPAKEIGLAE